VWLPGDPGGSGDPTAYSVTVHDRDAQSSTSITIVMRAGPRNLGALQCFFPRTPEVASIDFNRWKAIVGQHLSFEVR
jgi:hypothetical protein